MNTGPGQDGDCPPERLRLVEEIRREALHLPYPLNDRQISPAVLEAIRDTPREAFMPEWSKPYAYINAPASIGFGQTISQPFIVALMTELLDLESGDQVLEIGTGSGYQAAVLARLGASVYSVEIVEPLADAARARLNAMGYSAVHVRTGDGSAGWPEHAPYDAVIVTASTPEVPAELVTQMKTGARMVIPIGEVGEPQWLSMVDKLQDGSIRTQPLLPVSFVPLTSHRVA